MKADDGTGLTWPAVLRATMEVAYGRPLKPGENAFLLFAKWARKMDEQRARRARRRRRVRRAA